MNLFRARHTLHVASPLLSDRCHPPLWQISPSPNTMHIPNPSCPNRSRHTYWLAGLVILGLSTFSVAQTPVDSVPAATPPAAVSSPESKALLKSARQRLESYQSLKARVAQTIEFGNRHLQSEGEYIQAEGHRLRLDLRVNIGDDQARLLQVCDGDILYTLYGKKDPPIATRRDIQQILRTAAEHGAESTNFEASLIAQMGLGGIASLLAGIDRRMDLAPPTETEIQGRKFFVVEAAWKAEFRVHFEGLANANRTAPGGVAEGLPIYIPDRVRIYFDAEQLFPYRIRYFKDGQGSQPPYAILTLDFRDIVVNGPVEPSAFTFTRPEDAQPKEETNDFLDQIRPPVSQAAGLDSM